MLLEINDKVAVDWLKMLINNQLVRNSQYTVDNYSSLIAWQQALDTPAALPKEPSPKPVKRVAKKVAARGRGKKKQKDAPYECSAHPNFGGMRSPRTDCERCWDIYKQLNPMRYTQARRKFDLKANKG
jgi:hypothetical protein